MANFKIALVVLLAFGAVQCQSANVPEPEPKDLDVILAAQQVIKIVRNVVNAVEKGIADSKPSVDILVEQLTPELGQAVKKIIDKALGIVKAEKDRIEFMIKEVEELLGAIRKIKSCTDPQKKDIEKLVGGLENGVLEAVRFSLKNHSEPLDDLKTGFQRILKKARGLFDGEIKAVIECIKPGHPDAQKCIDKELEKIKKEVVAIAMDAFLFLSEAQETLTAFGLTTVQKSQPVFDKFVKDADPIVKKISDCIAKMK